MGIENEISWVSLALTVEFLVLAYFLHKAVVSNLGIGFWNLVLSKDWVVSLLGKIDLEKIKSSFRYRLGTAEIFAAVFFIMSIIAGTNAVVDFLPNSEASLVFPKFLLGEADAKAALMSPEIKVSFWYFAAATQVATLLFFAILYNLIKDLKSDPYSYSFETLVRVADELSKSSAYLSTQSRRSTVDDVSTYPSSSSDSLRPLASGLGAPDPKASSLKPESWDSHLA